MCFSTHFFFSPIRASMGPRLVNRGNYGIQSQALGEAYASMGPRLVNRGNLFCGQGVSADRLASMGPRLVNRGNVRVQVPPRAPLENASMGPRLVNRGNAARHLKSSLA